MKRVVAGIVVFLIAAGFAFAVCAQETNKEFPLLAGLDIPEDALPEGCSKPDLQPDDFPIKGLRQCGITTDSRAIAFMDQEATRVGAKSIEAMYYAVYKEEGELFVIGWAFTSTKVAREAYKNAAKNHRCFKAWQRGKYAIAFWRDMGTTDECMKQMAAILDRVVRRPDAKDR